MDTMEALNELREINARNEKIDHEGMIKKGHLYQQELERLQKEEEDRIVRFVLIIMSNARHFAIEKIRKHMSFL